MTWTHDMELEKHVAELQEKYGETALAIAVDRWQIAANSLKRAEAALLRLQQKIAHGCTDSYCEECDG